RGFPFRFSTEASINLADDPRLLELMRQANFTTVFIGIESPDTDALVAMQKKQNTRRSLVESLQKIYGAGIFVLGGFIVGLDSEKASVATPMIEAIGAMAIPVCSVAQLTALPHTQLTRRLTAQGRLLPASAAAKGERGYGFQGDGGLNFVPLRPRREI